MTMIFNLLGYVAPVVRALTRTLHGLEYVREFSLGPFLQLSMKNDLQSSRYGLRRLAITLWQTKRVYSEEENATPQLG